MTLAGICRARKLWKALGAGAGAGALEWGGSVGAPGLGEVRYTGPGGPAGVGTDLLFRRDTENTIPDMARMSSMVTLKNETIRW